MSYAPDTIRESVRQHYAERARTGGDCCDAGDKLYNVELLSDLPADVTQFSLGCGDPISPAALQPGETVVDLGSGGGLDCFLAARQVGPGGHVIGVDMTPEMLAKARAVAVRLGAANVEFREGYLEALPLEDNTADVVISNCVINLSPDKMQVFREIARVLKLGGRVAVSDIVTTGPLPEEIQRDLEAWGACVAGALAQDDYERGLAEAGFVDVRITPKAGGDASLDEFAEGRVFSAEITARKGA